MIPRAYINAWREFVPWKTNEQVEQDLVISRFIVEIFKDDELKDNLAFRGGTALHKLYLKPQSRYSEDIDLVQIKPGPIGKIFDRLKGISFIDNKVKRSQKKMNNVIIFSFDSEIPPIVPLKLKIEINCREHIPTFKLKKVSYSISLRWFNGECNIITYELNELLGTKLRALYQRKKGRDLFDIWHALTTRKVSSDKIIKAFHTCMDFVKCSVSRKEFFENMQEKLKDNDFRNDTVGLIRPEIRYNIDSAWQIVSKTLIDKI